MKTMRYLAFSMLLIAVAGCGSTSEPEHRNTTATSPAEPAYIEEQHAEAAFEQRFQQEYMQGKNAGFLRASTVRFRTPCHSQGNSKWTCEGWGEEAIGEGNENCFLVTATVTSNGVEGTLHTETLSPHEESFDVCKEGSKEGQPLGNLTPEG